MSKAQAKHISNACIFVIEDDPGMRFLYGELLESISIAARFFVSGEDFLAAYSPTWHGGVVLDLRMPGMGGIEVLRRLGTLDCHLPVMVVSGFGDVRSTVQAMKLGAIEFLEKPFANSEFIDTIQTMLLQARQNHTAHAVQDEIQSCLATLSAREREIAELIARGLTSREIAALLDISSRTVDVHRGHILEKLKCSSSVELAALLARIPQGDMGRL